MNTTIERPLKSVIPEGKLGQENIRNMDFQEGYKSTQFSK